MGGVFTTNQRRLVDLHFPELNPNKNVTWVCHVDNKTNPEGALYDIILGMDFMTETGMYVDTARKVVQWEENSVPLYPRGTLGDKSVLNTIDQMSIQSKVLKDAETRQRKIIEANYDKIDIDTYVDTISTLSN